MDKELIAYLDEKFREASREVKEQIQGLREETAQQFQEAARQLQDLRQETAQQFQDFRQKTAQQFEKLGEELHEENRLTRVLVESLHSDIKLLAEAWIGLSERQSAHESAVELKIDEVKLMIEPYYRDLNRRVTALEEAEGRQGREAMELIREKFGSR